MGKIVFFCNKESSYERAFKDFLDKYSLKKYIFQIIERV
jgi:hypothetical protein